LADNVAAYTPGWTLVDEDGNAIDVAEDETATLEGALTGDGGFTKTGDGTLILTNATGNRYDGPTIVNEGSLKGYVAQNTVLRVNGSALYDGQSGSHTLGALYGASSTAEVTGTGVLTVNRGDFAGTMTGNGDLVKTTADALTLSGEVARGNVTLDEGTLNIEGTLTAGGAFVISNEKDTVLGIARKDDPDAAAINADAAAINADAAAINADTAVIAATVPNPDVNVVLDILNYVDDKQYVLIHTDNEVIGHFSEVRAGNHQKLPTPDTEATINEDIFLKLRKFPTRSDDLKDVVVAAELIWNQKVEAHGTFNVDTTFAIESILARNLDAYQADPTTQEKNYFGWDGDVLTKKGEGILTLFGANTYEGGTRIQDGTLAVGNDGALGEGAVTMTGDAAVLSFSGDSVRGHDRYTLANDFNLLNGTSVFDVGKKDGNAITATLTGTIADAPGNSGGLEKTGEGTLILGHANAHTGGTRISEGTLSIDNDDKLGTPGDGAFNVLSGGILQLTATGAYAGWVLDDQTGNAIEIAGGMTATLDQLIGLGGGGFEKVGEGTLILDVANAYAGHTKIGAGVLSIAADDRLGEGTNTLAGGVLQLTGDTYTKEWTLSGTGNAIDNENAARFGALSGSGGFEKRGAGELTLEGMNLNSSVTRYPPWLSEQGGRGRRDWWVRAGASNFLEVKSVGEIVRIVGGGLDFSGQAD
jgi:autotransporter-associated beta strand protein